MLWNLLQNLCLNYKLVTHYLFLLHRADLTDTTLTSIFFNIQLRGTYEDVNKSVISSSYVAVLSNTYCDP